RRPRIVATRQARHRVAGDRVGREQGKAGTPAARTAAPPDRRDPNVLAITDSVGVGAPGPRVRLWHRGKFSARQRRDERERP
ncbi:hypothetical protein, partial [Embleya sp. NPDC005575]|uniref:hypothetical protein n=1 Tax=Embleya sp. NPDC005575 TaxID=3156892 RepID=UPI0033B1A5F5